MWAFRSAHEQRDARKSQAERQTEAGERVISGRRGSATAAITEPILCREVWRDLEQLLNTIALESTQADVGAMPHARRSILNFGLPDLTHRSIDELSSGDGVVEREIEAALKAFEPRLIAGSVRVRRDTSVKAVGLKIRFVVSADLSCRPVDIPLEFTADVEIDSGKFTINRL